AKVRMALARELFAFCRPAGLGDVMEDGVDLEGNVFLGVHVRMLDEQLVLDHCFRLLASSCLRYLTFSCRTVVRHLDQRVVVIHAASLTTSYVRYARSSTLRATTRRNGLCSLVSPNRRSPAPSAIG